MVHIIELIILLFDCECTEASKVVMQYVAAVSGKGQEIDRVKEQLLQSNPILEGQSQQAQGYFPKGGLQEIFDFEDSSQIFIYKEQRLCIVADRR